MFKYKKTLLTSLIILLLFSIYIYLAKQGYRVKFLKKEVQILDDSYYVNSGNKPELKICLVNQWEGSSLYKHFKFIKEIFEEKGYFVRAWSNTKDCDVAIDGVFGSKLIQNEKAFKIYFTGEAEDPKLEGYDLSLGFSYLETEPNYVRFPLYYLYFGDLVSNDTNRGDCNPNKEYFACFLVSNGTGGDGALARSNMFRVLSSYKKVASGGRHLNNIGRVIPKEDTIEFLSQCKFIIAYENNSQYPGYMTEKLFQAYYAGAIPLYYSHQSVINDVNKKAFIYAADFDSEQSILEYVKLLDQDNSHYCRVWNNIIINDEARNYQSVLKKIKQNIDISWPKYLERK
jgi:hypothetical protein